VARLQPEKGIDELLEATAALNDRVSGLAVVVAGEGPERGRLEAAARERALERSFLLLGHRPDIGRVLASADAFCLPSRHEGLPLSLLEGMRAGLPCVATAVGGIPGLVEDGVSGLLVPPRDPAVLAAAIERVLTDADLAARLGEEARRVVETRHSPAAVAGSYADLYGELASR
jgi:glycosyltransferase involved in cell wall biosynthesis